MSSLFQRWVVAGLVLAVTLMLVHGRTVGYRCDCDAVVRLVPVPDCHQAECHPHHHHADGCEADEGHDPSEADHSHRHPPVKAEVDWHGAGDDVAVLAGIAVPASGVHDVVWIAPSCADSPRPAPALIHSPPPPRRVFLTSVLLI